MGKGERGIVVVCMGLELYGEEGAICIPLLVISWSCASLQLTFLIYLCLTVISIIVICFSYCAVQLLLYLLK